MRQWVQSKDIKDLNAIEIGSEGSIRNSIHWNESQNISFE